MIKRIRYGIIDSLFRDKEALKAIAFVLFFYHKRQLNVVRKWSYNRLSEITGIHSYTIKKRIDTLHRLGFIKFEGSSLVFLSIVSRHKDRNINLTNVCYDTIKDVEKSLYAILLCVIQSRKDFCKRTILQARNARQANVVKKAQAIKRRYGYGDTYNEKGLSYKNIARKLGVSLKTAFDYVKYAIEKGFVIAQSHFYATYMPKVERYPVPGYRFTTHNYAYNVTANTYTIISNIFNSQTTRAKLAC